MIRSENEISAIVAKAARGAGLPLGVCEDLGAAVPGFCAGDAVDEVLTGLVVHLEEPGAVLAITAGLDRVEADGCAVEISFAPDPTLRALIRHRRGIAITPTPTGLALTPQDQSPPQPPPQPYCIDPAVWAKLEYLAARTYVLASDASRTAGAGAGLTDND